MQIKCGMPVFEGTEAHLLKCACVKIMHSYTIVPRGFYAKEEEEDEEEEKKRLAELELRQKQQIKQRFDLLKDCENKKIFEIMLQHPELYHYQEEEEKMELNAAFAEPNEEFKGIENKLSLLNPRQWVYLYPRINGQGRVLEVTNDDYDGIGDPEPCELKVATERINR